MRALDHSQAAFDALVDLLVEGGNEIVGRRWQCDKEGYHTDLRYPIDWALVHRSFVIDPQSILLFDNSIASDPEAYEVAYRKSMLV